MMRRILSIGLVVAIGFFTLLSCGGKETEKELDPSEFRQKLDEQGGVVIDVRTQEEYNAGHIAKVDYQYDYLSGEFEAHLDSLDKEKTYYLYCRSGNRSGQSLELMKKYGFKDVYNVGGYQQLVDAGFDKKK
ncbi:Rhodanese-related sulfurtransferase [Fodinibius salinus]|uniref:Rhodanese-related sulfurtransferase n=1 Tax=Fodinibius salinus TaxID=860790 RepID=A0A5D3YK83_9BACT|nr:rhodanese-like domain-containing protein [Fodinibius salinus]TYP92142.1 Rhodanese-related sulfurtransferase [Fodinibius salinus]